MVLFLNIFNYLLAKVIKIDILQIFIEINPTSYMLQTFFYNAKQNKQDEREKTKRTKN